jgi:hypothetical protein
MGTVYTFFKENNNRNHRHVEDRSTIFGTSLNYVCLRLLGVDKAEPFAEKARNFLIANGTGMNTT